MKASSITFRRMVEETVPVAKYIEIIAPMFHQALTDTPPQFGIGNVALYLGEPVLIIGIQFDPANSSWQYQSPGQDGSHVWFREADLERRDKRGGARGPRQKKKPGRKPKAATPPAPTRGPIRQPMH